MAGGYFADRYSKRSVTIGTKLLEVAVMGFAIVALALHNLPMECASVFLISPRRRCSAPRNTDCCRSFFRRNGSPGATASSNSARSLAASRQRWRAGYLAERYPGSRSYCRVYLFSRCTCVGLVDEPGHFARARRRPSTKISAGIRLADIWRSTQNYPRRPCALGWAVLGNTYLLFLAALLQLTIVIYGHDVLQVDETHISYLQAALSIGIGARELCRGLPVRRENRIRSDSARRDWHDSLRRAALSPRATRSQVVSDPSWRCSDFSADFSPFR